MSNDAITVGSKTTTGGVVISGNSGVVVNNQPVALVGDIATCTCGSKSCRGKGPIVATSPRNIVVNGISFAKAGDLVDTGCGNCYLAPSFNQVTLGASSSPISMGGGVSIGNGVNINISGAGVSTGFSATNRSLPVTNNNHTVSPENTNQVDSTNSKQVAVVLEEWKPVEGKFPLLVFETKNKMDDFTAPDMLFGDESKETIIEYGLFNPFKDTYSQPNAGYPLSAYTVSEDQFKLPAAEHFKRMRGLGKFFSSSLIGKLMDFETSHVFSEMVDKFERNEGGYYSNPMLTKALREHETTTKFHEALKICLEDNLINGKLPDDIVRISSQYMMSSKGNSLPQFLVGNLLMLNPHPNLVDGTVLSVHGIWSMQVYIKELEYKGNQVRGKFSYKIQDHFGLDVKDIDHNSFDDNPNNDGKPYEWLEGFRSWYLLQHYQGYGFKPFITKMDFEL